MKCVIWFVVLAVSYASSTVRGSARVTSVHEYPYTAALLRSNNLVTFNQNCAGVIINTRSVLTAANCFFATIAPQWRIRVGSTWANDGGVVHNAAQIINHEQFNAQTFQNDLSILRSASTIVYIDITVESIGIASSAYILPDNTAVRTVGWGENSIGTSSDQLRHTEVRTINQNVCWTRYLPHLTQITDGMLCSGFLDSEGLNTCHQDAGGPLLHNNGIQDVVIGIASQTRDCSDAYYPRINTRISSYTSWIQANA